MNFFLSGGGGEYFENLEKLEKKKKNMYDRIFFEKILQFSEILKLLENSQNTLYGKNFWLKKLYKYISTELFSEKNRKFKFKFFLT